MPSVETKLTTQSSLQIHIHIGPKAEVALDSAAKSAKQQKAAGASAAEPTDAAASKSKKRARPGKQKRRALALQKEGRSEQKEGEMEVDEEAAMNDNGHEGSDEEEVEMIET